MKTGLVENDVIYDDRGIIEDHAMATLSTVDMKLIDSLFGMYGGYVLNFSNATFASFFSRDIGIDIYDEAYAIHGTSKGKRLWGFLEIGQTNAVIKALHALWEIREAERMERGEEEKVPQARTRFSALIVKLGGRPLAAEQSVEPSPASAREKQDEPSESIQAALQHEFMGLVQMEEARQQRGYAFERFLKRWFDTWGLDAHASFRTVGEQIDGSFQHDGATYLVEAKWHNKPADANMLHGFQGKLLERPDWTRGLYVSYGGFSGESFDAFTARRLIMMDGADIYFTLTRRLDLRRVIAAKARHHSEKRQPFAKVTAIFPG
ncbi:restriction endonuclease [Bradyrhizobium sp. WU425]|uniref:restriction endonuclease n=1 Tax=Bradyrhizobium sp. WU425 TaxID=187029 RepID=UPI001E34B6A2|nr:restriction endonuclease [Bradyrhizobium canariense]UFW72660.1 restriction endonuclease [Bradyrhizobium canariense]